VRFAFIEVPYKQYAPSYKLYGSEDHFHDVNDNFRPTGREIISD
jgi:hypothetical protein